jgi:hypothetical protein
MRICSFDIENMYTYIPKRDTIKNNVLESNPEINMNIWKEITEQNYFHAPPIALIWHPPTTIFSDL